MMARNIVSVSQAVWRAGLTMAGTPASRVGASFSSIPQQGKLKALMCTATPCSGVRMCCAVKLPLREMVS